MRARFAFVACLLSLAACGAAEQLVFEDFEKLDLKALPPGWAVSNPEGLAVVDEPGRGKVLRITNKGNARPGISVTLDAAKVRGRVVRIAAWAKFPGGFTPLLGKEWAKPKIYLHYKDKSGKEYWVGSEPVPNRPEWQELRAPGTIDKEGDGVNVWLTTEVVAAEVFFDDFCIDVDPDLNTPPRRSAPAAAGTAPAPAASGNEAVAAKAPKKTLEDGGVLFSPDIAAALQKAIKPGATKNSYLLAGPGLPIKELDGKPPEKWNRLPNAKETTGPLAGPRNLLAHLPAVIGQTKPEAVILIGNMAPAYKLAPGEQTDWEDCAKLCLRLGVVPILGIPGQEELRAAMRSASGDAACPALDAKSPQQIARRVAAVTDMLDRFVFCRVSPDAPVAGTAKGPEQE